jgi:hypothetical protein
VTIHAPDGCVAVCAIGEALNYATDARAGLDAFRQLAQRAFEALATGGVFLFDVSVLDAPAHRVRCGDSTDTPVASRHDRQ